MDWVDVFDRERARSEGAQGEVLRANAAYGAGLALLMLERSSEASEWFGTAASQWQASWADATPTSWGRPIGVIKARLLADDEQGAAAAAVWALSLGTAEAESPIGRYAATLALLVAERYPEARHLASTLRERDDFPHAVADALALIAAHDVVGYAEALEAVLESFETRDDYLEDVPVAGSPPI